MTAVHRLPVVLNPQLRGRDRGEESIQLKGFREPVRYREIIWDRQTFGVAQRGGLRHGRRADASSRQHAGSGTRDGGRDRFVNRAAQVDGVTPTVGDRVAYLPRPAAREGRTIRDRRTA